MQGNQFIGEYIRHCAENFVEVEELALYRLNSRGPLAYFQREAAQGVARELFGRCIVFKSYIAKLYAFDFEFGEQGVYVNLRFKAACVGRKFIYDCREVKFKYLTYDCNH